MGKGEFWPQWYQNPWKFSNLNFTSMITPRSLHQCKFSFHSVEWGFSPDRWSRLLRFCDFLFVYTFYYSGTPQVEPVDGFSRFMAHTTCFRPRMVLLGFRQYQNSLGGNIPQNSPKGVWIGNFKPNRPNIKIAISCKV